MLKFFYLFRVAGSLSVLAWVGAVYCLVQSRRRPKPWRWVGAALACAVLAWVTGEINSNGILNSQLDRTEEIKSAMAETAYTKAAAKIGGTTEGKDGETQILAQFAEGAPDATNDVAVGPGAGEPDYRSQGKQKRDGGKKVVLEGLTDQVETATPTVRMLKADDLIMAKILDRINRFVIRIAMLACLGFVAWDYLRVFNAPWNTSWLLPIGGRWLASVSPQRRCLLVSHAAVGGDRLPPERYAAAALRKGEQLIWFGNGDPWPDRERLPRISVVGKPAWGIRKLTAGSSGVPEDPEFLLDGAWFGHYAVVVPDAETSGRVFAGMVERLRQRHETGALSRRTLHVVWAGPSLPPADSLVHMRRIAGDLNLVFAAWTGGTDGVAEESRALFETVYETPLAPEVRLDRAFAALVARYRAARGEDSVLDDPAALAAERAERAAARQARAAAASAAKAAKRAAHDEAQARKRAEQDARAAAKRVAKASAVEPKPARKPAPAAKGEAGRAKPPAAAAKPVTAGRAAPATMGERPVSAPVAMPEPCPLIDGGWLFACAQCGMYVQAGPEQSGLSARCPHCGAVQTVTDVMPVEPPALVADGWTFACAACGMYVQGEPGQAGISARCPYCQSVQAVPGGPVPAEQRAGDDAGQRAQADGERLAQAESERLSREEAERAARTQAEQLASAEAERLARAEAERVAVEAPVPAPPAEPAPLVDGGWLFACATCRVYVQAGPGQAGTIAHCPHCGATQTVPAALPVEPPSWIESGAVFVCAICGMQVQSGPEQAGTRARCPFCDAVQTVPGAVVAPVEPTVAQAQAESERLAQAEAERIAKAEAERIAKAEAERIAKAEADRIARAEAARIAQQAEAERLAKAEAERVAQAEAERIAKAEAERIAKAEADRIAQAEAARIAQQVEAERIAKAGAEGSAQVEAERLAKVEAERVARAKAERAARESGAQALREADRLAEAAARGPGQHAREEAERAAAAARERQAREAAARQAAAAAAAPAAKEGAFKFACTQCGQRLKVPYTMVGKQAPCPRCATVLTVPEPPAETPAPEAAPQDAVFKFACPSCAQPLKANRAWAGMALDCPACRKKLTVPTPG